MTKKSADPLELFHPAVQSWFREVFPAPTRAQACAWPPIHSGATTLLLAPTGSGKTLAAFLSTIDRLLFTPPAGARNRLRTLYVSPLKALAVDVERNLRAPIAGITRAAANLGAGLHTPVVGIRSGDTPAADRERMKRSPPDLLITTPESLFLLLNSAGRVILSAVETVIIDEIHAVAGTKRGAHLALSLERLERLREGAARPLQRIGLSATQRPLDEMARFLGGGTLQTSSGAAGEPEWQPRPVVVVDAGERKPLQVAVEVPGGEEWQEERDQEEIPSGPAAAGPGPRSIWPALEGRLLELIRSHRSTIVFVNNRRLAERLSSALNEAAGEEVALAHHGSIARETRLLIEDRLKRGAIPALVATSSLELGIDMGAVELVIQIESPPSVASGLQRIGRANHSVGAIPRGVLLPKHPADLLACAALAPLLLEGRVEETRYPRNPLDVLAQQIVAAATVAPLVVDDLLELVRCAAPFADLPLGAFEGVLDMLSGRYPSDEFRELRARLTWDRSSGTLRARESAARLVAANAGTIPDRGLYGVYLAEAGRGKSRRVGELDEEMVFETRPGEVFLLGASSWRVEEITHDRVLVAPAPGEPGKMPFWRGDRVGRSLDLGRAVGELARRVSRQEPAEAARDLAARHGLDSRACGALCSYVADQVEATGEVPSDRTIVVERYLDEVGDWRLCVLSPFGARVHAPWATAVGGLLEQATGLAIETLWSDDGMVFRVPETGQPPDPSLLVPDPQEVERLVVERLASTSLFAARFRENAARALLLPRRAPGKRNPLWAQRKRAADLLQVASRHASFPILLETYRECLRDVFDLPGLITLLRAVTERRVRLVTVDTRKPSPFAASLLFTYVANFVYDGDAPLAERRAQALTIDHAQLRDLLGDAELRELLDPDAVAAVERSLQRLDGERPVRSPDGLHDLCLALGDLGVADLALRCAPDVPLESWVDELVRARRLFFLRCGGKNCVAATEDAARYRDALGCVLPPGLPAALLAPVADPLLDLVSRHARTHGPFTAAGVALRYGITGEAAAAELDRLVVAGRLVAGLFLGDGKEREWCDPDALRAIKRKSLARLRKEVEPVAPEVYTRLLLEWQGVDRPGRGEESLLRAVQLLQGCPIPASVLEGEVLPARVEGYSPRLLDELCAAGEIVWRGLEPLGQGDGRVALYLRDDYPLLAASVEPVEGDLPARIRSHLASHGASFSPSFLGTPGDFAPELLEVLWRMVWAGEITNDTLAPLRSFLAGPPERRGRGPRRSGGPRDLGARARRAGPPGSEGRWSLLPGPGAGAPSETERRTALARTLLERHGILSREGVAAEGVRGGYSAVYEVLRAMEEAGKIRRGCFVEGLGASQFAVRGADDRLRGLRQVPGEPRVHFLSAVDPASPYGAVFPWPPSRGARLERRPGARVILVDGALVGYLARSGRELHTCLPEEPVARSRCEAALVEALVGGPGARAAFLLEQIDGGPAQESVLAPALLAAGFTSGSAGLLRQAPTGVGGAAQARWWRRGAHRAGEG